MLEVIVKRYYWEINRHRPTYVHERGQITESFLAHQMPTVFEIAVGST